MNYHDYTQQQADDNERYQRQLNDGPIVRPFERGVLPQTFGGQAVIEGVKIDVTTEELHKLLLVRIDHHRTRAAFYEDKARGLEEGGAEGMDYTGGDPVRALREKQKSHQNRREFLQFMADHLVQGETYRLDESDLAAIELISKRW